MTFRRMWAELLPVGRHGSTGGYRRHSWSAAERACRSWFELQARKRDLELEEDGNGNVVAWWRAGRTRGGVVTGSHLDSVPDGGAYDGPLGVVSGLAAVDVLRAKGFTPRRPIGVAVFVEEEGARFGVPCLGSRLMTGALDAQRATALHDASNTSLPSAMRTAGIEPKLGRSALLDGFGAFVELHVEQGRALDAPIGVASAIWPHGRWRFDFTGEANHAGTTPIEDRRDPMLTFAEAVLAARKQARLAGALATFGRVSVEPNGTNAIPSRVRAWLDARAPDEATLHGLVDQLIEHATRRSGRDETGLEVTAESVSPEVSFDSTVTERVRKTLPEAPVLPTGAGHDAGVLAAAGIPTAMLFVRNPSGISHAPAESATEVDCLAGVDALASVLEDLAGQSA